MRDDYEQGLESEVPLILCVLDIKLKILKHTKAKVLSSSVKGTKRLGDGIAGSTLYSETISQPSSITGSRCTGRFYADW